MRQDAIQRLLDEIVAAPRVGVILDDRGGHLVAYRRKHGRADEVMGRKRSTDSPPAGHTGLASHGHRVDP